MTTLKDHQQAMVDLLASGSGIPASASRLAHAMHDVLEMLRGVKATTPTDMKMLLNVIDATTPGLNDKALAADVEACRPKATPAERRVKELENTVKQLRASNAKLRQEKAESLKQLGAYLCGPDHELDCVSPEQAGCRKPDTQVCEHVWKDDGRLFVCRKCGVHPSDVPDNELRGTE